MNAVDYTPAPNVDGEVIHNTGQVALIARYLENGGMFLDRYEWEENKRRNDHKGHWHITVFGSIMLTREERAALSGVFK